jgi:restriction system protein
MDAWRQQVRELERADAATQAAYAVQRRQWEADWRAHAEAQAARNTQAELAVEAEYAEEVARWEARRADFEEQQREQDEAGQRMQQQYLSGEPSAVEEYCGFVLAASEYPESFPDEQDVAFNCENGMLIVDFALPTKDALPKLKEVKYVQTKDDFTESYLSDSYLNAMYDGALYQVALRTLHELFDADSADALAAITFNGWVTNTDPATGREVKACIMSVQTTKEEFAKINLAAVDPKACFRSLKGISAAKLHIVTPIAPVLTMSREDKRFVASYDVTGELDDSYNLACMDWEDFEHLIRELFEEEFTQSGGEVKVTQASRDGGVDAVAFDPDPIRGGKIVIQAKRYTNTVGVSAVRDLYGTVMNEGATKGILVTTSEYGPDAYEFARGKPLTLLSGGNLLSLLEKHGHKAKIDLVDARRIMHEREQMEGESHG